MDLQMAQHFNPASFEAGAQLWDVYQGLSKYHLSLAIAKHLVRLEPNKYKPYAMLATSAFRTGSYEEAIRAGRKAVELDPDCVGANVVLGQAYENLGDFASAREAFEKAERIDPNLPLVLGAKAHFLSTCPEAKFRNGKGAVELASKACKMTDCEEHAYLAIFALACAESGEFAKALEMIKKARLKVKDDIEADKLYQKYQKCFEVKTPYRLEIRGNGGKKG
jgi:Flp pilus assembly protein TadD